jgi:hypothetical protein
MRCRYRYRYRNRRVGQIFAGSTSEHRREISPRTLLTRDEAWRPQEPARA